ncbi:anthranilate phosphoribosyltransferase [Kangiella sp. TOML190]|uniref:anthranilate phosphoribosyltransferase n=1 Tax=Kangiella sp. TOML190 TaxID=2931351 RepID=UPI00203F98D8|nr:anthranilate phosphoribosyltransferase [Kangiella sp. TOML190]
MLQLLETLYQGQDLSLQQATSSFDQLLTGQLEVPQVAAMLAALKTKGESVDEIAGAAKALRRQAVAFPQRDYLVSDCCGTGGDGLNTINVSTLVAFVASSLGIKLVKHGNRSVSSKCGSSDLMQALNINTHLTPQQSKDLLDATNFCFLFAPDYHQGVKHVMPVRQSLKTRTIFNLIGPLANPAHADIQLLGVYDKKYCLPFAQILKILGAKKALIVNGSGLDEIAVHDTTDAVLLDNGKISKLTISPLTLGIHKHSLEDIQVSSLDDNLQAGIRLLKGQAPQPHLDMVAANCGALLYLNDRVGSIKDGLAMAKEQILSGKVYQHVETIRELSNA